MRALLIIAFAVAVAAAGAWLELRRFTETPIVLGAASSVIDIPRGTSLRALSQGLSDRGWVPHPWLFMALARLGDQATRIQAGEYEVPSGITPAELLALFTSGRVIQYPLTLVEGWTFRQVIDALHANERLERLIEDPSDEAVMARLGRPGEHPEGRFFPDTYHFTRGSSDLDILKRAHAAMERVLAEEWGARADGLPIASPEEALILASIVEKETGLAAERAQIAGVFVRRLRLGMRLQTDPTVIYGLGEGFDGNLRRADLRNDHAYNTYLHAGLPPTPIAMPGREAIRATLNPADGETLYFVARGDGSHEFSVTLDEHNRAVRKYQLGKP
ncbi:MAG: endolytic transglycosylase MltG [Chromatiaceae bacterium]|jgi:UPF0755 protein|nr:endolytic transglycosylase MltG [Chromatiaceae bacterium]